MTPISSVRGPLVLGLVLVGGVLVAATAPAFVASSAPIAVTADVAISPAISISSAPEDPAAFAERVAPEPRGRPVVVAGTQAPTEAPMVAAPVPTVPTQVPAPQACPATFFCYPRLGIAGPIVAYNDCSGATDVGVAIRVLTCVPQGIWLAGHAYTQFGRITDFRVGDAVFVIGHQFAITGSSIQRACAPTTQVVAPLSLQTSLESSACGQVLVVEGR